MPQFTYLTYWLSPEIHTILFSTKFRPKMKRQKLCFSQYSCPSTKLISHPVMQIWANNFSIMEEVFAHLAGIGATSRLLGWCIFYLFVCFLVCVCVCVFWFCIFFYLFCPLQLHMSLSCLLVSACTSWLSLIIQHNQLRPSLLHFILQAWWSSAVNTFLILWQL